MKNRSITFALILLVLPATITSCRKKGDDTNKSKTELLTQHAWQHDAYGTDDNGDGTIDTPITLDICRMDDLISFAVNGSGTLNQGNNRCFPNDPAVQDFSWEFANNEAELIYAGGTNTILSLTDHNMVLAVNESSTRYIIAFKH